MVNTLVLNKLKNVVIGDNNSENSRNIFPTGDREV